MNISLEGKIAWICGSTQGIGKAIAVEMVKCGAEVTLIARNEESLKIVISELRSFTNSKLNYIIADFQQPENLKSVLKEYLRENSAPHILVNNTGGPPAGEGINATTEEFIKAFNQHLICNHILAKAVKNFMVKEKYGRIINIISTSVKQPIPGLGVSNTIRGAVANWAKTLSVELGKFNITVNNILPGATNTSRLKNIIINKAQKLQLSEEQVMAGMSGEIPLKRFADPVEIASAVVFLASDKASYINGINLPVDGGRTLCL